MKQYKGNIRKMRVAASADGAVEYKLPIGEQLVEMNSLIGSNVSVSYDNQINCVHCGNITKKSFNQGYCYKCLITLAQCDTCIIKPELCHYHLGTCRDPKWGEDNCMDDHFVYLANTGTMKVGITRHVTPGISSRWIDQGASQAIGILRVKNRLVSGLVETAFKQHIADKTNWRTMLKGQPAEIDLFNLKESLLTSVENDLETIITQQGIQSVSFIDSQPVSIEFPVIRYPEKIKSINLDKELSFNGELLGIKGQYWMLDGDRVINMRKYAGYHIRLEA